MSRRYVYKRLGAEDLAKRIHGAGLGPGDVALFTGVDERRLQRILNGKEDVPPFVDLLTLLVARIPEASAVVQEWVDTTCTDREPFKG